jgi:uncharacterized membrane protein YqjE
MSTTIEIIWIAWAMLVLLIVWALWDENRKSKIPKNPKV